MIAQKHNISQYSLKMNIYQIFINSYPTVPKWFIWVTVPEAISNFITEIPDTPILTVLNFWKNICNAFGYKFMLHNFKSIIQQII